MYCRDLLQCKAYGLFWPDDTPDVSFPLDLKSSLAAEVRS